MSQFTYTSISEALPEILVELVQGGNEEVTRNGSAVEILNAQIVLTEPSRREVLCPGRGANVFAQIAETMWVLSGRNDIEWLSAYLPRAKDYSDDGDTWRGAYGPRLRRFGGWPHQNNEGQMGFDQWQYVIDTLRSDPSSRRAVISIYDPNTDVPAGKDVPCNDFLQFQVRDYQLHMTVTVRSNDLMWGWSGINAFEWSTMQEITAQLLGVSVGTLTFNIGNLHLYETHWKKAERVDLPDPSDAALKTTAFDAPGIISNLWQVDYLFERWFNWEALCRKGEATPALLEDCEEPLVKAWSAAIAYYWQREDVWLTYLEGTALRRAVGLVPASLFPEPVRKPSEALTSTGPVAGHPTQLQDPEKAFLEFVTKLHATKHASYGNSWKKRGEQMSILANIARKVDRLGVGDEYDSPADTVIDLWVYLTKYLSWLNGNESGPERVDPLLRASLSEAQGKDPMKNWKTKIPKGFDEYVFRLDDYSVGEKRLVIWGMMVLTAPIARDLWYSENEYSPKLGV